MTVSHKPQRVRDPLHNLIEFGSDQFEQVLWNVIRTEAFQRLRRIRQLAFCELVYPGATHTRFSHSIGVFHTARQLMRVIRRHIESTGGQYLEHQAHVALAASLVHDLGHGMFSHAFEEVGKSLDLKMADHEHVSDMLIRSGEVSSAFKELGSGFANDVAEVIKRGRPGNLYDAVVSSQFDADRLDYMQRDRLMTGVQNSGIDFGWLIANLQVATLKTGVDEHELGEVETFVLGPKALYAAETYVLSLFQLYPTVYFHKATRAAEKLFSALMLRAINLVREGHSDKISLAENHPIVRFARDPESLANVLVLDDAVFWGCLPMLVDASDPVIRDCSRRLRYRRLPKCVDIRHALTVESLRRSPSLAADRTALKMHIDRLIPSIDMRLKEWAKRDSSGTPRVLTDRTSRDPYKRFQESKGPLNQIRIKATSGSIMDLAECSQVVAAIETFEVFRAYVDESDMEARSFIDQVITDEFERNENDG